MEHETDSVGRVYPCQIHTRDFQIQRMRRYAQNGGGERGKYKFTKLINIKNNQPTNIIKVFEL